jgi:hypothetical protein
MHVSKFAQFIKYASVIFVHPVSEHQTILVPVLNETEFLGSNLDL